MSIRKRPTGESSADARLDDLDTWRPAVERWLRGLEAQGTTLHEAADEQQRTLDEQQRTLDSLTMRLARLERHDSLRTFTNWIADATLAATPLVSVVVPTRDRASFLRRAVASVLCQQYAHWELVIVDNGSTDDTPEVAASFDDRGSAWSVSSRTSAPAAAATPGSMPRPVPSSPTSTTTTPWHRCG